MGMKELLQLIAKFDIKNLFKTPTDNTFIQFFRYLFVGGIAFLVDAGSLFLLELAGLHYLMAAGIVKDLYYRDNTLKYRWIEQWKWVYERTFDIAEPDEDMQICFEGLDVFCDIYFNGFLLGKTDNMHIHHIFPVGEYLRKGENHIQITFYPPEAYVEGMPKREGVFSS